MFVYQAIANDLKKMHHLKIGQYLTWWMDQTLRTGFLLVSSQFSDCGKCSLAWIPHLDWANLFWQCLITRHYALVYFLQKDKILNSNQTKIVMYNPFYWQAGGFITFRRWNSYTNKKLSLNNCFLECVHFFFNISWPMFVTEPSSTPHPTPGIIVKGLGLVKLASKGLNIFSKKNRCIKLS